MAKINRSEVIKELVDGCRLDAGREVIPTSLADKVLPTFETKPSGIVNLINTTFIVSSGSATLVTTSSRKRTFLTGFSMSTMRTVVCDSFGTSIACNVKGRSSSSTMGRIQFDVTPTKELGSITRDFSRPIELEPGTTVSVSQTFTVGKQYVTASVTLYEVDP